MIRAALLLTANASLACRGLSAAEPKAKAKAPRAPSPSLAKLNDVQLPANVHYSPEGYTYLAEKVATEITARLP
jgi:hypothetical protein